MGLVCSKVMLRIILMKKEKDANKSTVWDKTLTIIGIILCVVLVPMLIINITLIIKSYTNSDEVPSVGGTVPLIVLTDSMYPTIESGDLIFCKTVSPESVKNGDIIAFFDPAGNGTSVVTHRVVEITSDENGTAWVTKGDANNANDSAKVPAKNLVGVYKTRVPNAGNVAMFMQTTKGLIICVICPIILLVGYDIIRRRIYDNAHKADTEALLKELEELKAKKAEGENKEENN